MSAKHLLVTAAALVGLAFAVPDALAQKKYDPGATDKEIKVGNIMPYSGPASAYGTIGKVQAAYFKMINDQGGINGRRINFISVDDGYSPPKTVEMARKLVEQDEVLLVFQPLGTPSNSAIQKYMNTKKVPQLFVATGATKWNDPKGNPWTMGWQPNYQVEAAIYAKHILATKPNAKIAVLFQNDDYGKDYLKGFKDGLGAKGNLIVKEVSYETSDPTVDSQIVQLQGSGADVFFNITTPKFAAQAIRKAFDIGWKPVHYLNNVSASIGSVLTPAGLDKSVGLVSTQYLKDPLDDAWKNDKGMNDWKAFMAKYYPEGDLKDAANVFGYTGAQGLAQVLRQCGDLLTRENVMKQAASLKDFEPSLILPGIKVNTSATDFAPIQQEQMVRFDGKQWIRFGEIMSASH
jgi:branched-chain amino acid transport system substrate-binding protein